MPTSPRRGLSLTSRAISELREAAAWYGLQRPGLGVAFLGALEATLQDLRTRPESFGLVAAEVRRALLDRFPYGVFFAIEPESVVVLAILHTRRDPRRWPTGPAR